MKIVASASAGTIEALSRFADSLPRDRSAPVAHSASGDRATVTVHPPVLPNDG